MSQKPLKLLLVAGEASADLHGSKLVRELKALSPKPVEVFGVGGTNLRAEGMEVLVEAGNLSIMGVSAVFKRLPELLGYFSLLLSRCETEKPDLAILIDLPDFNLRLARKLKKKGIPVLYYISPQVWAWRSYRIKHIKRFVDKMLVLFPFEKDFYESRGVPVSFVGHPLLDFIPAREVERSQSEMKEIPRLAILPGSRSSELEHHQELLISLVDRLSIRFPRLEVRLPVAPTLSLEKVNKLFEHPRISVEKNNAYDILCWADIAAVASGTATLEAALVGTPFFLFYSVSAFHAFLFRTVVRWSGPLGMANLISDQNVTQEFFQEKARVDLLEAECIKMLEDETYRKRMRDGLSLCRERLGASGASRRAAGEVLDLIYSEKGARAT